MRKTIISRSIAALCCAELLLLALASAAQQPSKTSGDARRGQQLYMKVGCYECHGTVGQGAAGTGPRLAPNPMPYAGFSAYLRHPRGEMPPYSAKVLSEPDLADVYAYLQSIPPPRSANREK